MKLTKEQVNKKYSGKWVKMIKTFDHTKHIWLYEISKSYNEIHEDTALGETVGTEQEYKMI